MTGKELLQELGGPSSKIVFEKLYGTGGAEDGKKRYHRLIEGLLSEDAFPVGTFPETTGDLRLFTAAGRTELGGNHTDHNRGRVVAASIQLDQAAVAAPRSDGRIFFRSSGYPDVVVDLTGPGGVQDLRPRENERGTTEALIRGIAAEFFAQGAAVKGFTINADSTVLPGSGLSSSAAVEVLFGRVIDNLYNRNRCSALEIAQIGQRAENIYFGKPCGLMDQTACAYGGAVAIDFADPLNPMVKQVDVDLDSAGYVLCVVNTRGSHADLTADYAAITGEMGAVASYFGKGALRECDEEAVEARAADIRAQFGDRALLRALHFFDENQRALDMHSTLEKLKSAQSPASKQALMAAYLKLVNESGDSSWEFLQNVYSPKNVKEQGIAVALAFTRDFLKAETSVPGACRVHGGGFAGTIQAYIPVTAMESYRKLMDGIFGPHSVTALRIRNVGAEELIL
ncbi:MAG: galactokinase [Spirochaetaceae bacterium]|jgi:galactokinase|nr:galactokinase [Spirochaetaceae bacterium]